MQPAKFVSFSCALMAFAWALAIPRPVCGKETAAPVATTNRGHLLQQQFVGRHLGMEGTELSCLDAEGLLFVLPPIERSHVAKIEPEDDRQAYAFAVACEAAKRSGASLQHVFIPRRQRTEIAHFLLYKDRDFLFGKAIRPPEAAEGWPEPAWTRFAAAHAFAPSVHDAPGMPHVLLTTYLPVSPLSRVQSFLPRHRKRLLRRLAEIHASQPARKASTQTPIGAAWARLQDAQSGNYQTPLSLKDLHERLTFIDEEMQYISIVHRVCHGDPAVGNTLMTADQVIYIDWEAAGWDDPYRDVARLVSNSQWPHEALPHILAEYLGRPGNEEELRHLALLVAAFDIDHYGAARAATGAASPYVARFARRVHRAQALLQDLPPVGLVSLPGDDL